MRGRAVQQTYYDSVNHRRNASGNHTQPFTQFPIPHLNSRGLKHLQYASSYLKPQCSRTASFEEADGGFSSSQQTSALCMTSLRSISMLPVCVYVCVHLFTGLLSRSACGVEHPLTLSCTQRNDSAWYTTLGDGEEKTKARAWGEGSRRPEGGNAESSKERKGRVE